VLHDVCEHVADLFEGDLAMRELYAALGNAQITCGAT
jgi:hypothetical protein